MSRFSKTCYSSSVDGLHQKIIKTGLYASFLKRQAHQGIFSLVKGNLYWNCTFLLEHFKGTKVKTRGKGGNHLRCLPLKHFRRLLIFTQKGFSFFEVRRYFVLFLFTAITCDRGMVYNECGSADALTCENYYYSQGTIQSCVPGCECPAGILNSFQLLTLVKGQYS